MPTPDEKQRPSLRRTGRGPGERAGRTAPSSRGERQTSPAGRGDRRAARRAAIGGMFAALALVLSYVDHIIPYNVGIPGIKLGLANLVILLCLYEMDARTAFVTNLVRILMSGLLFTGVMAMFYSLAGGLISFLVMWSLKKSGKFSIVGVSMAAGVAHNFGQLLIASLVVENLRMFVYFPILVYTGMGAGILMGFLTHLVMRRLPKTLFA